MDVPVHEFQAMVQDDTIRRLDLPHSLKEKAEVLSDEIGDAYTPQEALYVLQQMIQEHPTTLETAGVRVR
jgi:hypothetical protein